MVVRPGCAAVWKSTIQRLRIVRVRRLSAMCESCPRGLSCGPFAQSAGSPYCPGAPPPLPPWAALPFDTTTSCHRRLVLRSPRERVISVATISRYASLCHSTTRLFSRAQVPPGADQRALESLRHGGALLPLPSTHRCVLYCSCTPGTPIAAGMECTKLVPWEIAVQIAGRKNLRFCQPDSGLDLVLSVLSIFIRGIQSNPEK